MMQPILGFRCVAAMTAQRKGGKIVGRSFAIALRCIDAMMTWEHKEEKDLRDRRQKDLALAPRPTATRTS